MAVHTRDDHHRGVFTVCGSLGEVSANRAALHVVHRTLAESAVPVVDDAMLGVIPPLQPDLVDTPGDAVAPFRRPIPAAGPSNRSFSRRPHVAIEVARCRGQAARLLDGQSSSWRQRHAAFSAIEPPQTI